MTVTKFSALKSYILLYFTKKVASLVTLFCPYPWTNDPCGKVDKIREELIQCEVKQIDKKKAGPRTRDVQHDSGPEATLLSTEPRGNSFC